MVGCCFPMFLGWVLVDVTQALVLSPWVLRALCSGGSAALRGEEACFV